MASYDSDSSDGEFEETNVLLGYASKEADEDTISRLGGVPVRRYYIKSFLASSVDMTRIG
jgi:hypothetical protein